MMRLDRLARSHVLRDLPSLTPPMEGRPTIGYAEEHGSAWGWAGLSVANRIHELRLRWGGRPYGKAVLPIR